MRVSTWSAWRGPLLIGMAVLMSFAVASTCASGAETGIAWQVDQASEPTYLPPGETAHETEATSVSPKYHLTILNAGGQTAEGVSVTDVLPAGVVPSSQVLPEYATHVNGLLKTEPCEILGQAVICNVIPAIPPGEIIAVYLPLDIEPQEPRTITNTISVTSANGPTAVRELATMISDQTPPYELTGPHGMKARRRDRIRSQLT
jgi:hypothetical protein